MSSLSYRPDIDGLRTIAVIPVLLFHAGVSWFNGGYIGVDIFFVISGFLIASIILAQIDSGRFSLADFYQRRVRRIIPALLLVITVTIPFSFYFLSPGDFEKYLVSIIASIFFVSNFKFWRDSGYFDSGADEKPLLHTWSLGVEEQYYLVFPLLMLLLWRERTKWLAVSLVIIGALLNK
ncbi:MULTISPECIES: acyltransferase family protein [Idiomarina]|uniref:acyltransferase family protein n=1 Tax=Idiomarina TaxID=135575 RepID=UPI00129C1531|nr:MULTISPECIES: acyltransferase [Idiomarina]MRJ42529.1 acyltransferase family protein [Idiomarina sp. FeN1]NCU58142.1 acyltransferase family protein [Idiomarina sp. FenA--70]NCU60840.1 acyltransferase family protein [Idiomarina sp. FenBw--71]UUN12738.1 acyltransferase [Idiomarina loihiensis]